MGVVVEGFDDDLANCGNTELIGRAGAELGVVGVEVEPSKESFLTRL